MGLKGINSFWHAKFKSLWNVSVVLLFSTVSPGLQDEIPCSLLNPPVFEFSPYIQKTSSFSPFCGYFCSLSRKVKVWFCLPNLVAFPSHTSTLGPLGSVHCSTASGLSSGFRGTEEQMQNFEGNKGIIRE